MNSKLFACLALLVSSGALAGGYLWMGAEVVGEGKVYRYNIDTGLVDLTLTPALPAGASHFNNMATDGTRLYTGSPTTQYVGVHDNRTGAFITSYFYATALGGHKEDGAFDPVTGTLWRVSFSNSLHNITTSGSFLASYTGTGALIGLEWVGPTLYATNYLVGQFGRIDFTGPSTAQFVAIPWTPDSAASPETAALALDRQTGVLYMMANRHRLFRIDLVGPSAKATLVKDLSTAGLPAGTLVDGMGWAAATNSCPADLNHDGLVDDADFVIFIAAYNILDCADPAMPEGCPADLNLDNLVDDADFVIFVAAYNELVCP